MQQVKVRFSHNQNGDVLVLVNGVVVALAKDCQGYDILKLMIGNKK